MGVARAGTTTLASWLDRHDDISIGSMKEPKYLARSWEARKLIGVGDHLIMEKFVRTIEDYEKIYCDSRTKFVLDGSSDSLFFFKQAIKSIKLICSKPYIIICLRQNDERAWSAYMNLVRDSREKMSFEDALEQSFNGDRRDHDWMWDLYWGSLYSDAVLAYMHAFKKVKVISFEDLKNNPQAVVDDICRFLGASCSLKIDYDRKLSVSGVPKSICESASFKKFVDISVFARLVKNAIS